jgi:hypothetical protein
MLDHPLLGNSNSRSFHSRYFQHFFWKGISNPPISIFLWLGRVDFDLHAAFCSFCCIKKNGFCFMVAYPERFETDAIVISRNWTQEAFCRFGVFQHKIGGYWHVFNGLMGESE